MKKPEYLTGEALTFLEWCNWLHSDPCTKDKEDLLQGELTYFHVAKFYSQPFTKDMIVRPDGRGWQPLFKGEWQMQHIELIQSDTDMVMLLPFHNNWTTDDFIREAKKQGIKLEWK